MRQGDIDEPLDFCLIPIPALWGKGQNHPSGYDFNVDIFKKLAYHCLSQD